MPQKTPDPEEQLERYEKEIHQLQVQIKFLEDETALLRRRLSNSPRQVKVLEDYLGIELFRRVNRNLFLTDAGQACLPGIREAFDGLATAIGKISTAGRSGVLTVSVAPSFAGKWLLPRLDRFQVANPDIDVRVSASMQLVDFASAQGNVLSDRVAEQERLLRHEANVLPQLLQGELANRFSVDQHHPGLSVIDPRHKIHQCGLA